MAIMPAAPLAQGGAVSDTLAVVMHKAGASTERFIERHVRESFGGRTVVIARHAGGTPAFSQPLLVAAVVAALAVIRVSRRADEARRRG